jgi:hypothetical protein
VIDQILQQRHIKKRASERMPMSKEDFVAELEGLGVSSAAATEVWDFAAFYYPSALTPYPHDRATSDLRIDPEDLEDAAAEWWTKKGWKQPTLDDPVVLPADPSLADFARWLDGAEAFQ